MRCTCLTFLGMERRTMPPQTRDGMTTISGGASLLIRTRRGLAGPLRTTKKHGAQDAPGTDEAM